MQRGYIRNKIGSRIEGIRNRSRQDSGRSSNDGASVSESMPTYSQLTRMQSADGFLLIKDEDEGISPPPQPRENSDDDDDEMGHVFLDQSSGPHLEIEGDLEALATAFPDDDEEEEEEEEEPRSKRGATGVVEKEADPVKSKPWLSASKEVYEEQLELLQEQLMSSMMANQTLQSENADLKDSKEELIHLRRENAILNRRLQTAREGSAHSDDSLDGRGGASDLSPKLALADKPRVGSKKSGGGGGGGGRGESSYGGSILSVSAGGDGFENVTMSPDARIARQRELQRSQKKSIWYSTIEWMYEVVADFTEEQSSPSDAPPEVPLTAKKLKNNLQRLSRTSKPWRAFLDFLQGIVQWKNTAESMVVFLIYMYCVWNGWIIPMLLFLAILMLSLSYLRTSGLAEQFGFQPRPQPVEHVDDLGLGDKLQLIKQVGQTCQNKSELLSDTLEKAQNLFLWHQPSATRKIYTNLCVMFIAALFLPNSYLLTCAGLFVGIKLFIVDNIYRKYPKVKERYDGIARMWKSLPTDTELLARQSLTEDQLRLSVSGSSLNSVDAHVTSTRHSEEDVAFCSRFHLPPDELPLPSWQTGKRCSIMDKDRPLSLTRSGRLFLTHSHMCFERNTRPSSRESERFIISLMNVVQVVKAKPFAVLPGSGMSIQVTLKNGRKHLFSAILNRDQAYQSVLDQGMILGLPWGTDLEGTRETVGGGGKGGGATATSSSASKQPEEEKEGTD